MRRPPTTRQRLIHRRTGQRLAGILEAGVRGFHILDEIGVGMQAVLDVDDLAPFPALFQAVPGVDDAGGLQLVKGGFEGLEVVVGAAVGQQAAVALYGAEKRLVGIEIACIGVVVRQALVEPARELA